MILIIGVIRVVIFTSPAFIKIYLNIMEVFVMTDVG